MKTRDRLSLGRRKGPLGRVSRQIDFGQSVTLLSFGRKSARWLAIGYARPKTSSLSDDLLWLLVLSNPHEFRVSQLVGTRPLSEVDSDHDSGF